MKKTCFRALSVLTLLILLLIVSSAVPIIQFAPEVEAASSAAITLDSSQGYVGDYVSVTGRGFAPNKDVTFMWGDHLLSSLGFTGGMPDFQRPSYDKPGEVRTDALGNFIVKLQVPKLTRGTYTIKADDTNSTATVDFTISPRVILRNQYAYKKHGTQAIPTDSKSSDYYIELFLAEGFVGDWLALQLSGFGEGEIVEVKIGATTLDNFTLNSGTEEGYLFLTYAERVPEMPGGDYTVTATGKISEISASASFKVKPELFLASPPPGPTLSQFPWVYTFDSFGLSWYSSVNATSNSEFFFEATGLTGTTIQNVSLIYSGGSLIECQLPPPSVLTISNGSTQGINSTTAPFTWGSPFTEGLSPRVRIPLAIQMGKMLNVTITTVGAESASFTFSKQLFSSSVGTKYSEGALRWVEGDSTISSDGLSLSGTIDDMDKIVATGCNGSAFLPSIVYPMGSTVKDIDFEALLEVPFNGSSSYLSFFDSNGNGRWDSIDPVYMDYDNTANVTMGDDRVTLQIIDGKEYLPFMPVFFGDPDLNRTLIKFPSETRPSYFRRWIVYRVYLDKYGTGYVSEGDTRISTVLSPALGFRAGRPDANGFFAVTLLLNTSFASKGIFLGGGQTYNVGLWNIVLPFGVQAGNTLSMQITPSLEVTLAPTAYQSTDYVTEGSDVQVEGNGFLGDEALKISVGGKYVTTVTPHSNGTFSALLRMPALAGGEQSIVAQGMFTAENTASAKVTFTPVLTVSPTEGYNLNPVTSIMVTGKGFEAGAYQIIFDGAGIGEAVTSSFNVTNSGDLAGRINIAFNLPAGAEGIHMVDVVKTSDPSKSALYGKGYLNWDGNARPNAPFPTDPEFPTITIKPGLQARPATTAVGKNVTVIGRGLQPSETYYVWYDPRGMLTSQAVRMITDPATVTTDVKGNLTASFQVPQSSGDIWDPGTRGIWVSTSPTHVDNDPVTREPVYISITILHDLVLTPSSGSVGTNVSVAVSGLSTGTQYDIWWYKPEESLTAGSIPASAIRLATITGATYGNSTEPVSFTVPVTAQNGVVYAVDLTYTIIWGTRTSVLPTPVPFTVGKVSAKITLDLTPTTVTEGESVVINGFIEPAMSVNITLFITNPEGITTNKTVTSTASGTFSDTFKPDRSGTWQVKAKWNGNTVYAEFTSLAAAVTVEPIDTSWTYAVTGLLLGVIALVLGIVVSLRYIVRKKGLTQPVTLQAAPPTK